MNDDNKLFQQEEVDALLKAAARGEHEQIAPAGQDARDEPAGAGFDQGAASGDGEPAVEPLPEPAGTEPAGDMSMAPESDSAVSDSGSGDALPPEDIDALGEIGNISMGSAATTLSQLLDKRVLITSPNVTVSGKRDFLGGFNTPFVIIRVKFKEGFQGYNVLIIKLKDAIVMANLMMGGDGTNLQDDISEMEISAAAEAMNQMIGTASTSLADLLNRNINIMPPEVDVVKETGNVNIDLPFSDPIVIISFRMTIEDLLDTSIMQVIDLDTAREQSKLLWSKYGVAGNDASTEDAAGYDDIPVDDRAGGYVKDVENVLEQPDDHYFADHAHGVHDSGETGQKQQTVTHDQPAASSRQAVPQIDPDKLSLLLDIPLKVTVVLGRTKKQIKDVLQMTPGAIVEMDTLVGDPVEILINGKLVAKGEVVVVNENFGVKLTSIISTRDRLNTLNTGNMLD